MYRRHLCVEIIELNNVTLNSRYTLSINQLTENLTMFISFIMDYVLETNVQNIFVKLIDLDIKYQNLLSSEN